MADKSKIEWTDATWNPIRGCSVISEGCRNCYAMNVAARFSGKDQAYEGLAYRNDSGAHWTGKVRLIEEHLEDPLRWKRPRLIFVNSMSDLFHEQVADEWIDRIFHLMGACDDQQKGHIFQVLTKRPERMLAYMQTRAREAWNGPRMNRSAFPPRNVWLGVSCEDQKTADERIPVLIETPAAVRWISAEPLLGPIDFQAPWSALNDEYPSPGIHWVVVGGESGPNARPMHPDWARSLRDQCVAAGVPFFFKQWGEWVNSGECDDPCGRCVMALRSWDGKSWRGFELTDNDWEAGNDLVGALQLHPVGKKKAGRLLDGREWNEYPDAQTVAA